MSRRMLFMGCLSLSLLAAPPPPVDPVQQARLQRAADLGIAEGDLPPVPRGIVEPPPLPPPEAHVKDTAKGRKAAAAKAKKGKAPASKSKAKTKPKKAPKGKG